MKRFPNRLTFAWLRDSYAAGELTPCELAEEIARRAEQYASYHIWIDKPSREKMKAYTDRLPKERNSLPLWGIPFAVKDNIDLAGVPTTAACPEYAYIPKENAAVVQKLIDAGAFPVGKTNLDQFATGLVGTRSPYGEVKNALNPKLISGGSSSGSAVAAALGMAAFSLGTDTAGSGRVPAALNGLVGYKPPLGAWSVRGVVPACASLDCVTVFANNLEDAAEINRLARGYDEDCCWSREYPEPKAKLPQRICIPKDEPTFFGDYARIYREKWEEGTARLKGLGPEIQYMDYGIFAEAAKLLYEGPWVAERWCDLGIFAEQHPGVMLPVTEEILRNGDRVEYTAAKTFGAIHRLQELRREAKKVLKDAVLALPTAGGTFTRRQVRDNPVMTNSQMGLYTNHCNLLELCGAAIPQKKNDEELPFGITFFGTADAESLVLGLADAFLKAEPGSQL
ncbi:allophanate hydrolase [Lactonifactor longoviformis]|uniref:Allophanate hydrolase n=2 Tax=Lactonifactor TaxID=420345 RepID=A0A1M4YRE8_9CLOT|nr:allophanate hydrolase [Lactonifactor longoviformis]SHF08263.1 allophanate hydrolase [Lactonifactor longoviformis DSM 17459]